MSPPDGEIAPLPYPGDTPCPGLALVPRLERLRHDFAVQWADEGIDTSRCAFWLAWLAQEIAREPVAAMDGWERNLNAVAFAPLVLPMPSEN